MTVELSYYQLGCVGLLILALCVLTYIEKINLCKTLFINAIRAVVQLSFIGIVLDYLFKSGNVLLLIGMALVMMFAAAHEIRARQTYRMQFLWSYFLHGASLFIPAGFLTLYTLIVVLRVTNDAPPSPWYDPRYSIPFLGMILGNTMSGIALGLERLQRAVHDNQEILEQRLMHGDAPRDVILPYRKEAIRAAMIPTINLLAVTGLVSLPGMMTGQMLAGNAPASAAKYQIMILFLITVSASVGIHLATYWVSLRMFDKLERLRLDRFCEQKK